jgi:hypothetical protein
VLQCPCVGFTLCTLVFTPRASLYFTVRLIVAISLCSILLHNLITNREAEFVVELMIVFHYLKSSSSNPDFDISILTSTMIFSPCVSSHISRNINN